MVVSKLTMAAKELNRQPAEPQFEVAPDEPVYVIGVVSELIELPVWTLRVLDRQGVVKAKRREGRGRLYSLNDLRLLSLVRRLMIDEGVNMQGVRVIIQEYEDYG
jgi:DNA-binding transcriptional MerR regulator